MSENIIDEAFITESSLQISMETTEIILKQMKKSVCKILNGNKKGTGFFCNIPLQNDKIIKVLITNYHVIGDKDLATKNFIKFSLNDDEIFKKIILNNSRIIFTNKKLDTTFIEIEEKDIIENKLEIEFLNLDKQINADEDFINDNYSKIYTLQYIKGEKLYISYGLFKGINKEIIYHECNTEAGASGCPILSLKSLNIIGIHRGYSKNKCLNAGIFIKYSKNEFIKFLEKQNKINNCNSNVKKKKMITPENHKTIRKKLYLDNNSLNCLNKNSFKLEEIKPFNTSLNNTIKKKSFVKKRIEDTFIISRKNSRQGSTNKREYFPNLNINQFKREKSQESSYEKCLFNNNNTFKKNKTINNFKTNSNLIQTYNDKNNNIKINNYDLNNQNNNNINFHNSQFSDINNLYKNYISNFNDNSRNKRSPINKNCYSLNKDIYKEKKQSFPILEYLIKNTKPNKK